MNTLKAKKLQKLKKKEKKKTGFGDVVKYPVKIFFMLQTNSYYKKVIYKMNFKALYRIYRMNVERKEQSLKM